ncbi:MAG: glycosyltransferase family 2 protein [Acidobacteria bacterium]|nr:glycosyltransferase family 2 protein [Acidobacteriota bacterium]MCL5289249.1 glycosyltransferase family 2 protein [Acidobacteriota bacterium]
MKYVFWLSVLLIGYSYAGFPLWLYLRSRWRAIPVLREPILPFVSIVMAVRNEAQALPGKLKNLEELNYPPERLEIVVASDASTDATNALLAERASNRLRPVFCAEHAGKAAALNQGIQAVRGEIVLFTDARQMLEGDALRRLVERFADPAVGCVSGELMLGEPGPADRHEGVGLYWKMEKKIREWEGAAGSVVGATGAIYAVRKKYIVPLPAGTILDDVYIPLHVARQGGRVVFEPGARAWDNFTDTPAREFGRKVRTLTGNYQLLQLAPWLLTRENPVRFEFISHKLLRLCVPFALAGALGSSLLTAEAFYRALAVAQLALYSLALLALVRPAPGVAGRLGNVVFSFLMLNTAAVVALINFLTGKKEVWVR